MSRMYDLRGWRLLAALSLLMAAPAAAQDDIDLESFEDFAPELQEVPQEQTQPRFRETRPTRPEEVGGPQFEEFRPQIEELELPSGPAPTPPAPAGRSTPMPSPGAVPAPAGAPMAPAPVPDAPSAPLPTAVPRPVAPPPAVVAPAPVVPAPQPVPGGAPDQVRVQTQTPLPVQGLAADGDFRDQIQGLNRQISLLREKVIEAKSRLLSYSQKVAQGFASGTQVYVNISNNLGGKFRIEKIVFYLDGHQVFSREFDPEEEVDSVLAYRGSVLPGRHRMDVDVILNGKSGMFDRSYSARLRLESGEYFAANEGKIVDLGLVLFDKGGRFTSIDERPALKFEIVERDVF